MSAQYLPAVEEGWWEVIKCIRCLKRKPPSSYYLYDGKPHENICKACKKEYAKQYRKDNWEQCKAAVYRWKESNPVAYKKVRERAVIALRKKRKENPALQHKREKALRDKLSPCYVRLLMARSGSGLSARNIPDELMEVKREVVKLKRRIREWQQ